MTYVLNEFRNETLLSDWFILYDGTISFQRVKTLKDEGNKLYKEGYYLQAISQYGFALDLRSVPPLPRPPRCHLYYCRMELCCDLIIFAMESFTNIILMSLYITKAEPRTQKL